MPPKTRGSRASEAASAAAVPENQEQQQQQQQQQAPAPDAATAALLQLVHAMQLQQQQQQELISQLRQQAAPQALAPAAPLTLALHTAQEIPTLKAFTREAFLVWSRDIDAYLGRCQADELKPRHLRHAFVDTMVSQVLSALGKPRGDARSAHWIGISTGDFIPGLEAHFFKDITAGQACRSAHFD